jgi:hypothetical protein
MASGSMIAATGLEPLQSLFQNLTWTVLLLICLMVLGSIVLFVIRTGCSALAAQRTSMPPITERLPNRLEKPPTSPSLAPVVRSSREVPLLMRLRAIDWFQFEKLVEIVYRKKGYQVDRRGGANPDGGIDLVLLKDCDKVAVQCKHWKKRDIGVQTIRQLLGAMQDAKISKGMLVTISRCTKDAEQLASRNNVQLVEHADFERLVESVDGCYDSEIQQLLEDTRKICPKCEQLMQVRTAKTGPNAGRQFWGCCSFPACKHTERYQ